MRIKRTNCRNLFTLLTTSNQQLRYIYFAKFELLVNLLVL